MKKLTKEEIEEELAFEKECGVNTLLQDITSSEWEGKKIEVIRNKDRHCSVRENKMKILICTSEYPPTTGGFANVAANLNSYWIDKGHVVEVIKPHNTLKNGGQILRFWKQAALYINIHHNDFDVIWCQNPLFQEEFEKKVMDKIFCTTHTTYNGRWEFMPEAIFPKEILKNCYYYLMNKKEKKCFKNMKKLRFITTTEKTAQELKDLGINKSIIIPNGIDIDKYKMKGQKNKHQFCAVSRLVPWKNVGEVVDTFNNTSYKLKIAGDGAEMKKLKQRAGKNIKFLGKIPQEKVIELYQESEYFISASKYEGMPLALIEAMACGCKPVVSQIPGHKEVCDAFSKKYGDTYTAKDASEFTRKNYDWSKIADRYLEVFKNEK